MWGKIIDYFLSIGNNPERTVTILGKVAEMVSKLNINYFLRDSPYEVDCYEKNAYVFEISMI